MANEEHLAILKQGVEVWNLWRYQDPLLHPDLSHADLRETNLSYINFEDANLSNANLMSINLSSADLSNANLSFARLSYANLSRVNFVKADLREANISFANLQSCSLRQANLRYASLFDANLSSADFSRAILCNSDLSGANLSETVFYNADLSHADLRSANCWGANLNKANLSHANFEASQVLSTNFAGAVLTGACIADWQIGSSTKLDDVTCDYIFRILVGDKFTGRLPVNPNSTFAPGEFTQRFQLLASAQETIDITFTDGIDWQAFFTTFQELRSQYPDSGISIQGLERKAEGFIVRLEVNQDADKAAIETQTKQIYAAQLKALEAQYEKQLRLQGEQNAEEMRQNIEAERQEKATLMGIIETMAKNQGPKYDLRGSYFAGGFAGKVEGDQIGGSQTQEGA